MKEEFKKVMGYARAFITSGEILGTPETYYEDKWFRDASWSFGKCQIVYAVFTENTQAIIVIDGSNHDNPRTEIRRVRVA